MFDFLGALGGLNAAEGSKREEGAATCPTLLYTSERRVTDAGGAIAVHLEAAAGSQLGVGRGEVMRHKRREGAACGGWFVRIRCVMVVGGRGLGVGCRRARIVGRTETVPADVDLPLAEVVVRDVVERGVDGLANGAEGAAEARVDEALVCGGIG